ncbi:MAG: GDSL-type esterase/lipase family protein, partial [Armatimonadota bacterium]
MFKAIVSSATLLSLIATGFGQTPIPKQGDADFPTPTPSERHNQKVAAVRSHNYDLFMIGDSITHTVGDSGGEWEPLKAVWQTHFAARNAINLGYSGYRTENVLWNLQNGELDSQKSPKVAVVLIGTNNTDDTNYPTVHSPEQIFDGTKAIVETIRKKHPTTKILVLS